MDDATREIFSGIGSAEQTAFFALAYTSLAIFATGLLIRMWYWARGAAEPAITVRSLGRRAVDTLNHVFLEPRLRTASSAGWLHLLIFWGFLILFVGTELLTVEIDTSLSFFSGLFYLLFSLTTDVFGILLLVGVGMAAYRRYVIRPARTQGAAYGLPLLLLGLLAVTGFGVEGLRIAHTESVWYAWSPAGALVAALSDGMATGSIGNWHHTAWWLHAVIAFGFIASIPFGAMRHAVVAPLSLFFYNDRPAGRLSTPYLLADVEAGTLTRAPPQVAADMTWTQFMALDACTECGLCEDACPAWAADRPLSPKKVVVGLRDQLNRGGAVLSTPLGELVGEAAAWSCTTCGACMSICPVGVRHIDYLVDARRAQLTANRATPTMAASLETLRTHSNPFGMGAEQRLAWAADLPAGTKVETVDKASEIDVLYWVGCAGAFDEQGQRTARAVAELLGRAGVRFAVLGPEERCTGDPARRLGEEGLFQQLARANVERLDSHGVTTILTTCPHCFNTLKNEYPDLGGNYDVVHHTDFLASLMAEGCLTVSAPESESAVTYHDSCYLGRHNNIYDAPRELLRAVYADDLQEMDCAKTDGFCCGAGGGHAWFDLEHGVKINGIRYGHAAATGAETLVTACPYCRIMFDEISSSRGDADRLHVRDVAEIVNEATRP